MHEGLRHVVGGIFLFAFAGCNLQRAYEAGETGVGTATTFEGCSPSAPGGLDHLEHG